jgi:peptidyl-prolyl cis-trans isomerase A (cyclophilin A)/peptidyl-prolyl cis-trans isomerase B (cyclophilin B)
MTQTRFPLTILALLLSLGAHATGNPHVSIKTNFGEMIVELYPEKAPRTVDNFLRYVQDGFYKGTIFHRVINDFVIQGGGLTENYEPKKTLDPIPNEADNGLKNEAGALAMARAGDPNSATTQFFINLDSNRHLDFYKPESYYYGYCVFGKVVKGLDVAKKIGAIPTAAGGPFVSDVPQEKVVIEEISPIEVKAQAQKPADQPTTRKKKDVKHG